MKKLNRRDFLKAGASLLGAYGLTQVTGCKSTTSPIKTIGRGALMPTRPFGQTGFNVCILSLGGQAALEQEGKEELSGQIIQRALDLGVNYIDTSAAYGGGLSERNIGRVIKDRRQHVFLATKSRLRDYDGAMRDLEKSLINLQTDYVDLWQIHNLQPGDGLESLLDLENEKSLIRAFLKARSEGMARFIGITCHTDPAKLTQAITSTEFDATLMAVNAADIHEKSFIQSTIPAALDRKMGIIAMKIPARGRMFREGGVTTMAQALGYVLSQPVSTAIVGCLSVEEVEANVELARNFEPFSSDELKEIEDLTLPYYRYAAWFKRWDV